MLTWAGPPLTCSLLSSRQLPQCMLREKAALGDLPPPQQQQLTAFLQQLQALKPPRCVGRRPRCVPVAKRVWRVCT